MAFFIPSYFFSLLIVNDDLAAILVSKKKRSKPKCQQNFQQSGKYDPVLHSSHPPNYEISHST